MHKILFTLFTLCIARPSFSQTIDYGQSKTQIEILNLDCLHEKGFTGKGVNIAHFDDGYDDFAKNRAFKYARKNGLLKATYDFVEKKEAIDATGVGSHGLQTMGVVNGYLTGEYVGAAFDAGILLAHTEDNRTETHNEEKYWRQAVDWALENGADIITSSLQYNNFDEGEGNFKYEDMDGNSTLITNAADYAASKGILVVAIQGNFGDEAWYYLTAPGDADSVITVGASMLDGRKAALSSFGPSFDQRVKPDVLAVGEQTAIVNPDGTVSRSNGTSYAGPAIAGLAACLIQAHPDRSNMEIIAAIRQSADKYQKPDVKGGYGYGIPDACKAHDILTEMDERFAQVGEIKIKKLRYQVFNDKILLKTKWRKFSKVVLLGTTGEEVDVFEKKKPLDISSRKNGHYIIRCISKKDGFIEENVLLR